MKDTTSEIFASMAPVIWVLSTITLAGGAGWGEAGVASLFSSLCVVAPATVVASTTVGVSPVVAATLSTKTPVVVGTAELAAAAPVSSSVTSHPHTDIGEWTPLTMSSTFIM